MHIPYINGPVCVAFHVLRSLEVRLIFLYLQISNLQGSRFVQFSSFFFCFIL
jgi:hypothetical protein